MGLVPLVGVEFRGTQACHLRVAVRLTIYAMDGARLPIEGNGAEDLIDTDLPEEAIGAAWWWRNWCGDVPLAFHAVVTGAQINVTWELDNAPVCISRDEPSTLVLFGP
jgi:hypothetical protein